MTRRRFHIQGWMVAIAALSACKSGDKPGAVPALSAPVPAPAATSVKLPAQTIGKPADCSTYGTVDIEGYWGPGVASAPGPDVVREITGPENAAWSCGFAYSKGGILTLSLGYRVFESEDHARRDFAEAKQHDEGPEAVQAGEDAFVTGLAPKATSRTLYVRKGNVVFVFTATNPDGVRADYTDRLLRTYQLRF